MKSHATRTLFFLLSLIGIVILGSFVTADPETTIITTMTVEGDHVNVGDFFYVRATVTNIGTVPAENVVV